MARKLRIQFEGAIYHVVNRGNYRRDLFETVGAAEAFLSALFEATVQYGWRLHAYVLMRNHYHLALETPQPNLIEGMHWGGTKGSGRCLLIFGRPLRQVVRVAPENQRTKPRNQ